jgi:hypothetical protein
MCLVTRALLPNQAHPSCSDNGVLLVPSHRKVIFASRYAITSAVASAKDVPRNSRLASQPSETEIADATADVIAYLEANMTNIRRGVRYLSFAWLGSKARVTRHILDVQAVMHRVDRFAATDSSFLDDRKKCLFKPFDQELIKR